MNGIPEVHETEFKQKVLDSLLPVVVEFSAEWCHPCKALEPVLKQLAQEWSGKADLVQVNVDDAQGLTQKLSIFSVPTVMLFIKGQPVERLTGFQTREKLKEKLGSHL
jgi:thioredoxin 1